jgi:hypothetical protein
MPRKFKKIFNCPFGSKYKGLGVIAVRKKFFTVSLTDLDHFDTIVVE